MSVPPLRQYCSLCDPRDRTQRCLAPPINPQDWHKYFLSKIDQQQTAIFVSQRRKLRPKGSHNVFLRGEEDPSWTLGCDEEEEARGCEHIELQVRFLDD